MSRVLTNNLSLAYTIEDTLGEIAGSPVWNQLEPNDLGRFGATITTVARTPISRTRQRRKGTVTDLDSAVEFEADLTLSHFADFAEGFVFATFNGVATFSPSAVVATGSGSGCTLNVATAGSGPYTVSGTPTVAAGGTNYVVGDLLEINGTGTKAVVRVATLSGSAVATVAVVSVGSYSVDPAGATVATTNISAGYTVASGGALPNNSLVFARGFTNDENNGLKLINNSSTATKIRVTGLVVETPPSNAVVNVAGIQGASGDIQINSSGNIISSSLDFTTLNLTVGQVIWVGGATSGLKFATAANNGYARITSIAANALGLDKKATTFVTDNGSGKTIQLLFGRFLRNVSVDDADYLERSFQFEAAYPDLGGVGVDQYEYAVGNFCNEMSFELPLTDKATMSFNFVGTDTEVPTGTRKTNADAARVPNQTVAFNTSSDIARLRITEVDETGITTDFKSLSLTLNNNVSPEKVLGNLGARYMNTGIFEVNLEAELLFTDSAVVEAVRNNTTVTMDFAVKNDDGAIFVDIPSLTLGSGEKSFPLNESVTINVTSNAFQDTTLGTSIGISLFPYLPA